MFSQDVNGIKSWTERNKTIRHSDSCSVVTGKHKIGICCPTEDLFQKININDDNSLQYSFSIAPNGRSKCNACNDCISYGYLRFCISKTAYAYKREEFYHLDILKSLPKNKFDSNFIKTEFANFRQLSNNDQLQIIEIISDSSDEVYIILLNNSNTNNNTNTIATTKLMITKNIILLNSKYLTRKQQIHPIFLKNVKEKTNIIIYYILYNIKVYIQYQL